MSLALKALLLYRLHLFSLSRSPIGAVGVSTKSHVLAISFRCTSFLRLSTLSAERRNKSWISFPVSRRALIETGLSASLMAERQASRKNARIRKRGPFIQF